MSYLPRMSKTYKEPQEPEEEEKEPEQSLSFNSLKPASSLLNEKTHNPQVVLKHYKYLPHAPPVLPGPSVLEEVTENELFREASRIRRSASKMENLSKASEIISGLPSTVPSENDLEDKEFVTEVQEKVKRTQSKKGVKSSKSNLTNKKSSKNVKKDNFSSHTVNPLLVNIKNPFSSEVRCAKSTDPNDILDVSKLEFSTVKSSLDDMSTETGKFLEQTEEKLEPHIKEFSNRSVQCTIFGSQKKLYVIPRIINSLLRTLAFLLHEISLDESFRSITKEKKSLTTQIQLLLGDMCNQKIEKEFSFDTSYSDSKRLEKILGELKKYLKDTYGDTGENHNKTEDLKKLFIELKTKEMQLAILTEKHQEDSPIEIVIKESDFKAPEITLQNKRLESEQLVAELEFSKIELRKCQNSIAELEWDIKTSQEQLNSLKKSSSKSKTEVLGKKSSALHLSGEAINKGCKTKESEISLKKKH